MGWLDRIGLSRKESVTGTIVNARLVGQAQWSPRDYAHFAAEGYQQNVIAFRCISLIQTNVASIPIYAKEGGDVIDDHPATRLLNRPNPRMGRATLLKEIIGYRLIAGNSYLEALMIDGDVKELWPLRPDRMKVVAAAGGGADAYKYTVNQASHTFEMPDMPDEQAPILHMKEFNPLNDFYGQSPMEPGGFSIDTHNEGAAYQKALLQNNMSPSGALTHEGKLDDVQFKRLKKEMEENYSGAANAGKPMLLEGGLSWASFGMNMKDGQFGEGRNAAAREIAMAFGVPPLLLGLPGDNTYANYKEANSAFHRQTVLPLMKQTLGELSVWLEPSFGEFDLAIDEDDVEAFSGERQEQFKMVNEADFLTIDEKRKMVGMGKYEPSSDPGGVILAPATEIPIDDAGFQSGGAEPDGDS